MGDYLYCIMSDIVLDLRKNKPKVYVFAVFMCFSFFVSIISINGVTLKFGYKYGLFFGLATGMKSGFWYFFMLVVRNAFSMLVLASCSCGEKIMPIWQVLFSVRMMTKFSDAMRAMRFTFVSCAFSALVCIIFEIIVAVTFFIIYVDLREKRINVFSCNDGRLLTSVVYPMSVAVLILSALQAILCSLLIF